LDWNMDFFRGRLPPRKCIVCGEDYLNTPYPNRSMVCRYCRRIIRNRLHRLGAEETFRILVEKRGRRK